MEEETRGTDAAERTEERKTSSICTSLEIEPFKIRYSKHPSFARYSSCGHNKPGKGGGMRVGGREGSGGGRQSEIKNEREREIHRNSAD